MTPARRPPTVEQVDRLTEDARVRDCPKCDRRILRGICDGCDTRVDLRPLSVAEEAALAQIPWSVFEVQVRRGYAWLIWRPPTALLTSKRRPTLVMPKHICQGVIR